MRVEFPNDNPELWRTRPPPDAVEIVAAEPATVAETVAESVAVAEAVAVAETESETETDSDSDSDSETETDSDSDDVEVVEFDDADFAAVENESLPPPAPAPDAFQVFVRTLVEVALAAGAPAKIVEALPGMLGLVRLDVRSLDDATVAALVGAGLLARSESGAVTRADAFVATAQAWRATLLGEEADFSACTTMLDEWSATLVATLAGAPAQRETWRRELRSRGIAAFGLVEAA